MLDILKALNSIVEAWNVSCFGISSSAWLIFITSQFLLSWKCQFLFWNWSFRWHDCARKFWFYPSPSAINISCGSNIWRFFASTIWQLLKATAPWIPVYCTIQNDLCTMFFSFDRSHKRLTVVGTLQKVNVNL